ncbi:MULTISPECIES: M56 family metallopeptidase [unclassified Flavobacterium]|uniref:M56 family metallopeptidase n=1 Tax=unclassified Flavobacterium TaxID=196869 RepID=UPI003F937736
MEPFIIYGIKSSGLLALFFISYFFILRKETFFNSNRWFLLTGLFTSVLLPLLVYTKVVWIEPVVSTIDWSTIPVTNYVEEKTFVDYLPLMAMVIYGIGVFVLLNKFLYDFYSLRKLLKGKLIQRQADYKFVDTKENLAPFSFFNTIVYNSELYSSGELDNILEHEKVHSDQNHTVDVLVSRVFCVLFWFNPFIWLYKKAIMQNLEFIADSEATKKLTDKKAYQITLLKITTQENCVAITNHFYQSLIKKRIVMLNKNQSHKMNSWKYFSILPALVAFMFLFQIEVIAQEKTVTETTKVEKTDVVSNTTEAQQVLDTIKKMKKVILSTTNNGGINENTEIYIDGKKVSKEEMEKTHPNDIKTMNVSKNNHQSTIRIITKNGINSTTTDEVSIWGDDESSTELQLEKTDITNLNGKKHSKKSHYVTVVKNEKNGIPEDTEIYIDGERVSADKLEELNPNFISKMEVNKSGDSNKKTIFITKKGSYSRSSGKIPQPPVPPTAPTFNFKAPKAPNFPKAPKAPKGDPITGDKRAWNDFEEKMKDFNKKMEALAPEIELFDKKMADFDKRMAPFNAQMEKFEKKMKVYEKQMEEYQAKIKESK